MPDKAVQEKITRLLQAHRIMTLATLRPDGWPHATTVSYVNHGLALFCFVSRLSQKFINISRDPRVSIAIAGDFSAPSEIRGLSFAARAHVVEDGIVFDRVWDMVLQRFPEYAAWPKPLSPLTVLLRLDPEIAALVDYSRAFGHSELVTLADGEPAQARAADSDWLGRPR